MHFHYEGPGWIWVDNSWGCAEGGFQLLECCDSLGCPGEFFRLLTQQRCEGGRELTITGDEMAVKVCEPQKMLEILDRAWLWPVSDCFYLGMIHPDALW